MGDRTTVYVTAPAWADKALPKDLYSQSCLNNDGTIQYEEGDVYPEESQVAERLDDLQIGYDMAWNAGECYPAGECWVRYKNAQRLEVKIDDEMRREISDIALGGVLEGMDAEELHQQLKDYLGYREIVPVTVDVKDIPQPEGWEKRFPPRVENPPEDCRKRAEAAMQGWCAAAGVKLEDTDPIERTTDFLTDMWHLASYHGMSMEEILRMAESHFNEEKNHG